jgi:hypothetical protein
MARNLSKYYRRVLVVSGALLLAMAMIGPRWIWGLLGVFPLLAGLTGLGPLFQLFGFTTRRPAVAKPPAPFGTPTDVHEI